MAVCIQTDAGIRQGERVRVNCCSDAVDAVHNSLSPQAASVGGCG